jgi:hypothetical protein
MAACLFYINLTLIIIVPLYHLQTQKAVTDNRICEKKSGLGHTGRKSGRQIRGAAALSERFHPRRRLALLQARLPERTLSSVRSPFLLIYIVVY